MRTTSRRTAAALVVALVVAFLAAGLALAATRSGQPDAQPAGVRPAVSGHTLPGTRRAADQHAVLTAGPATAGAMPSAPLTSASLTAPPAPTLVPPAARGPPNLAVTVIN